MFKMAHARHYHGQLMLLAIFNRVFVAYGTTWLNERFNADKLNTIVKELGSIPRLTGSDGEAKGIGYCKNIFKEINPDVKEEEFECVRGWAGHIIQSIFAFATVLIIAMVLLLITAPWANSIPLVIVMCIVLILVPGITGSKELMMIGKKYTSKNLSFNIPPQKGPPKQYILLTGHHDTKSQVMTTKARSVAYFLMVTGLAFLIAVVLAGIVLDFLHVDVPQIVVILGILFGVTGLCGTIPLSLNFIGNKSPGAIDNASSVAVIYEVARRIKEQGGLENTEVAAAVFGAEEVGMWGAKAFMR